MRKIGGGDARGAGVPQRGAYRLSALNVEEVQDDARVRAEGTAEADVGEQRVGDLPRRAGHAYPQDLLRRHASAVRPAAEARLSSGPREIRTAPPPEIWLWSSMECCSTAAFCKFFSNENEAFCRWSGGSSRRGCSTAPRSAMLDWRIFALLAVVCLYDGCVPPRCAPPRAPPPPPPAPNHACSCAAEAAVSPGGRGRRAWAATRGTQPILPRRRQTRRTGWRLMPTTWRCGPSPRTLAAAAPARGARGLTPRLGAGCVQGDVHKQLATPFADHAPHHMHILYCAS